MIKVIDRLVNPKIRDKAVEIFKKQKIVLPTFAQMKDPSTIPAFVRNHLKTIGLWDLHPLNLFRITWHNEPKEKGGLFSTPNYIELPQSITGVQARIVLMVGKWFPTGAHKVGAAYGCLAPRIITGEFDPTFHKAVWPSTGNYCRGGAFDSYLMGCTSIAILPEEMSRERFDWLKKIGAEIIATKGCESNVKEIYDACWDIRKNRKDGVILNQFDEFGNPVWHYNTTGPAIKTVFDQIKKPSSRLSGYISATGSGGTIAAGDYLRTEFPHIQVVAAEALQCPTLLSNGYGGHRIEGIGDKHVPWIHNVRNTNAVSAIDDEDCMRILRLFNDPKGTAFLKNNGVSQEMINQLSLIGISGICNLLSAIKTAKYFEMDSNDILFTLATDSAEMYQSRLQELNQAKGAYTPTQAAQDWAACLIAQKTDYFKELTYENKKAIHHLKYYTWVEQQGKTAEDLNQLWYDTELWQKMFSLPKAWDPLIEEFNQLTNVAAAYQ